MTDQLKAKHITDIVISGDIFHYRDEIAVNTIHLATEIFNIWKDFNIIMLVGNHDAYYKDKSDINSLSIFSGWSNVTVISDIATTTLFGKVVTFCPWGTKVHDMPKSDIIFGHFEIKSFKENTYKINSTGIRARDILDKGKLVVTGHFHLREERIYKDGTILYLGNPFQMNFGDIDSVKGYYILSLDDLSYEFTKNNMSPEHKKIVLSDLAKAGKLTSDVKDGIKNNFVKFIIDRNISPDEVDIILNKFCTLNPSSVNVDYAVNFNKYQIDEDSKHDFSGVDIASAIDEFVNLMEIDNKEEVVKYTVDLYNKCT